MDEGWKISIKADTVDTTPPTTPTHTIRISNVLSHSGTTLGERRRDGGKMRVRILE